MKDTSLAVAEKFIRSQFKIMKKHGSMPKLDAEQYRRVVVAAQKTFQSLGANAPARPKARSKSNGL